jgi:hypothetical protein
MDFFRASDSGRSIDRLIEKIQSERIVPQPKSKPP